MEFDMTNYFDGFNTTDSYIILLILFVAFLFGLLVGYLLRSRKVVLLKREIKDLKKKLGELETEIEALKEQIGLRDADLKKASFDIEERDAKVNRLEREKAQLSNQVVELQSELEKLQASNKTYASTIEDMNDQILGLKAKNTEITKQKIIIKDEHPDLDGMAQFQSTFNATRLKLESLEDRIEQLGVENEKLKEQVEDLQDQKIQPLELAPIGDELITERSISEVETITQDGSDLNRKSGLSKANSETEIKKSTKEVVELFVPEKTVLNEKILVDEQEKDELTRIEGLGPFLETKLNEIGIFTFAQLASLNENGIEELTKKIGYFKGRIQKDRWVEQAAALHKEKLNNPYAFAVKQSAPIREEDLKIIEGIGPKIEHLLKEADIISFQQLAEAEIGRLRDILDAAGDRYRIHDPGTWSAQARLAANGEWELLEEYQEELKGGREVK